MRPAACRGEKISRSLAVIPTTRICGAAPVEVKADVAIEQSPSLVTNPPAGQIWRSYYFIGSVRVAVREASGATSVLSYIVTDHLG